MRNDSNVFSLKEKTNIQQKWQITISPNKEYIIRMPYRLYKNKSNKTINEKAENLSIWANIQTKIVSGIQQFFDNPHTYMRLYTYYFPKKLLSLNDKCQIKTIPTKDKGTYLCFIPDCQNKDVWKEFFETGTGWHGGMSLYTFNYRLDNWEETIPSIYGIVENLIKLHPISEFKDQLEQCSLLCYSVEAIELLVIAKTTLSESNIFSVLTKIANEEGLQLYIDRK